MIEPDNPDEYKHSLILSKERTDRIYPILRDILDECLSSCNMECPYTMEIDGDKCHVTFPIVEIPKDNYVAFAGY